MPTKRPFSPPKSDIEESRPPSRGTAERVRAQESAAAPAPAPPSSVDVAMTLIGRSALLHRGTYVRDRNVRFYKARYEEDPDDKPRSAGPASSLQLERAGAAVQDLLYALLMLDSLLDAGPAVVTAGVHRARPSFRIGTGAPKISGGATSGSQTRTGAEGGAVARRRRRRGGEAASNATAAALAAAGRGDARREDRRDAHFDAGGAKGEGDEDFRRHARGRGASCGAGRASARRGPSAVRGNDHRPGELVARGRPRALAARLARVLRRAAAAAARRRGCGLRATRSVLWRRGRPPRSGGVEVNWVFLYYGWCWYGIHMVLG